MTLLEVILSLAILGGTVAIIGESARSSFQNARLAKDLVQAELLAERFLAEIQLGIREMETVIDEPVTLYMNRSDTILDTNAISEGNVNDVLWYFSVEILPVDDYVGDFLVGIAVTVRQNVERRPAICRLVRWVALEPVEEEDMY
jgi:type II secretory pathway pseudopilin PulG